MLLRIPAILTIGWIIGLLIVVTKIRRHEEVVPKVQVATKRTYLQLEPMKTKRA